MPISYYFTIFSKPSHFTVTNSQIPSYFCIHIINIELNEYRYSNTNLILIKSMSISNCVFYGFQIRYSQVRDSGFYECQISTTPPHGYAIYLNVVGTYKTTIFVQFKILLYTKSDA